MREWALSERLPQIVVEALATIQGKALPSLRNSDMKETLGLGLIHAKILKAAIDRLLSL